ncbi:hypothetical protein [Agromyces luteolus]|uniref:Uncharacterized protein n=1 Tax=Agromyces luteolus TaxID=88373 RepID=A0A7C9LGE5_9MICO|nr:hypothetical protein [Agromyces luteolus]MUN08670.1 hypothetical protein [Agromyces luteolus]
MRFVDSFVDRAERYSLGVEQDSGTAYLSIPVSSSLTDYEEYYALSDEEYASFGADPNAARAFAEECRRRAHDDRLVLKPGSNRGST